MEKHYRSLTGRRFDLGVLSAEERAFLDEIAEIYRQRPDWTGFARTWMKLARERLWKGRRVPVGAPVYRICQDMEARLGIAEGRVASPDYRDRIADLIEERYGSRYAFCKETGIDQGNLSRVLVGKTRNLSPETLFKVLEHLQVEIELVQRGEVFDQALDPFGPTNPTERLTALQQRIAMLRNLRAMSQHYPPEERGALLEDKGLFSDDLETVRVRIKAGEPFETAVDRELGKALDEKVTLTQTLAKTAADEREAHGKAAS